MKNFFLGLLILLLLVITIQCTKPLTFTCDVDTSKTGYDLAGAYDDCLVWNAQKTMTHIEKEDIDIRATKLPMLEFGGSYATLNAAEIWIQPFYTFITETGNYPTPSASINNVVLAKLKSKDSVDAAFEFSNDEPQGICADVQQQVYDTVLNTVLTKEQRDKYLSLGKQLSFIPDDDQPPLSNTTNPVGNGSFWLDIDPATKVTHVGNNYFYEPLSLYVAFDDPAVPDELRGVRYCKLLSHQALLSWMLEKSFEENPVLITPTKTVCDGPSSLDSGNGSCLMYFKTAQYYYCSDFTGSGFTPASAQEKCETSLKTYQNPIYSTSPCSARTAEIAAYIPGYMGLTGICVIHCKTPQEFIWNIYTADPEKSCAGFDFFTPAQLGK